MGRPIQQILWIIELLELTAWQQDKAAENFVNPNGHELITARCAFGLAAFAFCAHPLFIGEREGSMLTEIFLTEGWCYEIHVGGIGIDSIVGAADNNITGLYGREIILSKSV